MNGDDYLKDYYKSLEEAPLDVLEEHEGNILAVLEDFEAAGDEIAVQREKEDLKKVRELIEKRREN